MSRGRYDQIANCGLGQSEINIAIGAKAPETFFGELADQCRGGKREQGGITDLGEMRVNPPTSCLPVI